jgi:hypothetical protein
VHELRVAQDILGLAAVKNRAVNARMLCLTKSSVSILIKTNGSTKGFRQPAFDAAWHTLAKTRQ